jgi:uncharacterized phage-like protein YoqJ
MIVAFSGHRMGPKMGGYTLPNPTYLLVCRKIEALLKELKPEKVLTGGAIGVDQWAAFIAYRLNIPYVMALPFQGQEKRWSQESQTAYRKLLSKAAEVVIVSEGGYSAAAMQLRNQYLVDHCDQLIAFFDGQPNGGTHNCLQYAKSIDKPTLIIPITTSNNATSQN